MSGNGSRGPGELVRTLIGIVLFVAWGVLAILWVYSIAHAIGGDGEEPGTVGPLVRGVCALLLMSLLAGMEGLEVAVIDRWNVLYPDRPASELAGWLAARQLFVALIVTTATILAEPESVPVPFTDLTLREGLSLKLFTIIFIGLLVLWFMQILPKHLAATNPDRYLRYTKPALFPVVQVVHVLGIARPAEMVAMGVERRLDWHADTVEEPGDEGQLESLPVRRGTTLASAWAALIPDGAPARGRHGGDRAAGTP